VASPAVSTAARAFAVLGAGSWGTALAIQLARKGNPTVLWGRDARHLAELTRDRCNRRYLPDAAFPELLQVEPDLGKAVGTDRTLLLAVPSHGLRGTLTAIAGLVRPDTRIAWATKGFEVDSGLLPHQVAMAVLGKGMPMAVLSGPTFAREVGAGMPTAITIASTDAAFALDLARSLSDLHFRAYTSTDIVGVEVGGAVKNVLAIGAGISDGLGFGANSRVALITRGLVEMTRLGIALGARPETFVGLAGLGDLVLTCTDNASRNRRFGLALAAGTGVADAERQIGQVVEGLPAALAVRQVAERAGVEMPLCEQVYRVVHTGLLPTEGVRSLMSRDIKAETG
jgi:glycerol-3-phosphate dehydrogenase (NAD(P)+)